MAMAVEVGSLRSLKFSATQLHSSSLHRPNSRIVWMPVTSCSNRFNWSISVAGVDPAPSPPTASSTAPPPAAPHPEPTFSMAHPKYVKGLDSVDEDRGEAGVVAVATAEAFENNTLGDTLSFSPGKSDLLVVGPGVLGSLVAQQWFKVNEGECNVVGQTNTTNRHEQLRSIGIIPITKVAHKGEKFPYVIFCAPPSGSEDYAAEVRAAAERWNGEGSLLFTSSSAVYAVSDNGICDEETAPIVPKGAGPRTDRLHGAEEEVLKVGGNVVRLAGLYTLERGAHSYYLSQGTIAQRADHIVNLIHYEDAASLCVAILRGEHRGRTFLGCDNHPVSRQEIMDAVNKCGKYDKKFEGFTTTDGPLGKRMNNDSTRRDTGWKPKYESFPRFLGVPL